MNNKLFKCVKIFTQGVNNFKNWKNQKLEEQFRQGIIKVKLLKNYQEIVTLIN